jgi:hypothetical protein
VAAAYEVGQHAKLDPTLILAIMAVESSFNPFAQSAVGAQGLMQVMTNIHSDKYENFGGKLAAFDPVTNLRVGVKVLQECIARAGSVEGGLKLYVGAGNNEADGGYAGKVLGEHARLAQVAKGRAVPGSHPTHGRHRASGELASAGAWRGKGRCLRRLVSRTEAGTSGLGYTSPRAQLAIGAASPADEPLRRGPPSGPARGQPLGSAPPATALSGLLGRVISRSPGQPLSPHKDHPS